jgi:signal transduction histidine kinase
VRAIVEDACSIYTPLIVRAGVDVEICGDRDVTIEADRGTVLQALLHVLENAILAAADGRRRRQIVLQIDHKPALIRVRDSGEPVPPTRRRAIFDPFYSARGAEGLGLYFARELLRGDGGDLTIAPDGKEFILLLG